MNPELQRANDMLAAMQAQRDGALNAMVHAQAEIVAQQRTIAARDQEVARLQEQLALQLPRIGQAAAGADRLADDTAQAAA